MTTLLKIGLIIIPFYEVAVRVFPDILVIPGDTRGPKLTLALMLALGIGLLAVLQGKIKAFSNKGILAFAAYSFMCMNCAPYIPLFINDQNSAMFWMWKPIVMILIFTLFITAISSAKFSQEEVKRILNIIAICAAVMSAYIFIQRLGVDQFFMVNQDQQTRFVENNSLVGVLGQPTLVASFLAIVLPITACVRRPFCFLIVTAALILINSKVALGACVIGMGAYAIITRKKGWIALIAMIVMAAICYVCINHVTVATLGDSGRFAAWKDILLFWNTPFVVNGVSAKYTMTGFGPGSYEYIYPTIKNSIFHHPHNEYIYILFNFGILGLGIILYSIAEFFVNIFKTAQRQNTLTVGMISSVVVSLVCAGGTFILGLGAHSFYLAVIIGILLNTNYLKGGEHVS